MTSDHLSNSGLRALGRIGDIICPGDDEFPSYSETGCIEHVDRMLATVPPADMKDLNMLLTVLSFTPAFFLRWLVTQMAKTTDSTSTLAGLFRMLDFGLRGIIFGTYYSGFVGADFKGKTPNEVIGFEVNRVTD